MPHLAHALLASCEIYLFPPTTRHPAHLSPIKGWGSSSTNHLPAAELSKLLKKRHSTLDLFHPIPPPSLPAKANHTYPNTQTMGDAFFARTWLGPAFTALLGLIILRHWEAWQRPSCTVTDGTGNAHVTKIAIYRTRGSVSCAPLPSSKLKQACRIPNLATILPNEFDFSNPSAEEWPTQLHSCTLVSSCVWP